MGVLLPQSEYIGHGLDCVLNNKADMWKSETGTGNSREQWLSFSGGFVQ